MTVSHKCNIIIFLLAKQSLAMRERQVFIIIYVNYSLISVNINLCVLSNEFKYKDSERTVSFRQYIHELLIV